MAVARDSGLAAGSARPVDHPFRALGHHQAQSMARSRPGQAEAAERLHAVLQQFQRNVGPVYRRVFRRHSERARSALVFQARNIRTRSRSRPFKNYIRANQIDTDYYYNSVPGAAQRDIKSALRVRRAILALAAKHGFALSGRFQKLYIAKLSSVEPAARSGCRTTSAIRAMRRSPATTRRTRTINRDDYVQASAARAAGKLL